MGQIKICIYSYLIADILTNVSQKRSLSGPLPKKKKKHIFVLTS